MPLKYSFAGKKVLITGGGQGIGRQLVQSFHDDGATVFTVDKNPETVQKLKDELPNVQAEAVDLTDWKSSKAVIESFGPVDHLVNNAGVVVMQNFLDITEEAAKLQYDVNVGAIINVTQTVAKQMISNGIAGTIVNFSSMGAVKTVSQATCYSASKAAVVSLTKSMAAELGVHGIRANCILPGSVDTPMIKVDGKPLPLVQQVLDTLIFKRLIEPKEIADLIMFLLSPLSSMITGEQVQIDGGWSLV